MKSEKGQVLVFLKCFACAVKYLQSREFLTLKSEIGAGGDSVNIAKVSTLKFVDGKVQ